MTGPRTSDSFGRYLQSVRLEKSIRLETIAGETRIGRETLIRIEKEDHDALPAEVFVRGFLRAYARVVGASEDEALHRYDASRMVRQDSARSAADLQRTTSRFWLRFAVALFLLAALVGGSIYTLNVLGRRQAPEPAGSAAVPAPPPPAPARIVPAGDSGAGAGAALAEAVESPAAAPMVLEIETVADTWMKTIIDEQEPVVYNLKTGDRLALEASRTFNLLVGNAGGVRLMLDGRRLRPFGRLGQVVNIQLP